ncbi:MAG: hypothetical protein K0R57_1033 [Paenibacillaceae bacterium]|jgi:hypothetical protein|nr:hypothetical protein [Paenibacillaceae bacterium]
MQIRPSIFPYCRAEGFDGGEKQGIAEKPLPYMRHWAGIVVHKGKPLPLLFRGRWGEGIHAARTLERLPVYLRLMCGMRKKILYRQLLLNFLLTETKTRARIHLSK